MKKMPIMVIVFILLMNCNSFFQFGDQIVAFDIPSRGVFSWYMDMNVTHIADGSFHGEYRGDYAHRASCAGDLNGDGMDDIVFASYNYDGINGEGTGKVYIMFGRVNGWPYDFNLSNADASFEGEIAGDWAGRSASGRGDVNGDGIDDLIIASGGNDENGDRSGQVYLIFGKRTGWERNVSLSEANASFLGENAVDWAGNWAAIIGGDVNGDGYDDILIGAQGNDDAAVDAGKAYLIFGKRSGWSMDTNLDQADATFLGENAEDALGRVAGPGDVNGDGYDDIIIGAYNYDHIGLDVGKVYLIFGKADGWSKDFNLSFSDASFIGEEHTERARSINSGGDVNGDGFNDFLIGAGRYTGDDLTGRVYLIFGKSSGWQNNMNLTNVNATFIGEDPRSNIRFGVLHGDLNSDGLSDLLISDGGNSEVGNATGQVYIITGRRSGWIRGFNLSNADASIIGENIHSNQMSGTYGGDVNGDGTDDLLLRCLNVNNTPLGRYKGMVYLVTSIVNSEPLEVYSIDAYSDSSYTRPISISDKGEFVFLELIGLDGNESKQDSALINITFDKHSNLLYRTALRETGKNTGIYRGSYFIPPWLEYFNIVKFTSNKDPTKFLEIGIDKPYRPSSVTDISLYSDPGLSIDSDLFDLNDLVHIKLTGIDSNPFSSNYAFINITGDKNISLKKLLELKETGMNTGVYAGSYQVDQKFSLFENITVHSVRNEDVSASFMIHTPIQLRPLKDHKEALEDVEYRIKYWNFGYHEASWTFSSLAPWLLFDEVTHELYGIPNNNHVGSWDVYLKIEDGKGHSDSHEFQIQVINTPPEILTEDVTEVYEDEEYNVDYSSSDDGQGEVTWKLITSAGWLSIKKNTGLLTGLPRDEDRGIWNVTVAVNDGNDGINSTSFKLEVINVNKPPQIINADITTGKQGERYYRDYEVHDTDKGDTHTWELTTDASFLTLDEVTGILDGRPGPSDVGVWSVNITVIDSSGLMDSHVFDLTIEDENDRPIWDDIPGNVEIQHGRIFYFDVNASDPDKEGSVQYTVSSKPESDISIDPQTGEVEWIASIRWFDNEPYRLDVTIRVSDGELFNIHIFRITVIPTEPPTVEIIGPEDGIRTPSSNTLLEWEGSDPEDEPITYNIYIHENQAFVDGRREEALHLDRYEGDSYTVTGLPFGRTYYWMVIPHDGCSYGVCTGGIRSFTLNNPPKINEVPDQKASTGSEFKFRVSTSDDDDQDKGNLIHTLIGPPQGMKINEGTGTIRWTPSSDQTGWHTITVGVYDGVETTTTTFDIEVIGGEEAEFPLLIVSIIGVTIALVIILLLVFLLIRKREPSEKEPEEKKDDEETEEIIREMEEHHKELDWEHDHYGELEDHIESDVPLSAAEAHAHDKDKHKPSYEELYGKRAPEKERDGMTAKELKDFIHEKVEELEASKK